MWQKTASSKHTPTQNSSRLRVVAVRSSSRCSFFSVSAAERLAFHQMPRRFRQIADKINNGRPADVDGRFADHCRHTERTERRRPGESADTAASARQRSVSYQRRSTARAPAMALQVAAGVPVDLVRCPLASALFAAPDERQPRRGPDGSRPALITLTGWYSVHDYYGRFTVVLVDANRDQTRC